MYRKKITPVKLCLRSHNLGYYKNRVVKILEQSTPIPFSTEKGFLYYLLSKSIPSKVKSGKYLQAAAIIASIVSVGVGSIQGRIHK